MATETDKIITEQGLTMKGVLKIERINCDASYMEVNLRTWQINRIVRRDFYLVCYKLFFSLRHAAARGTVRRLLADVRDEADRLETMAQRYELPTPVPTAGFNLRLVNEESRILLETLFTVDKALAKLKASDMQEVADENCIPYFVAYTRLKKFVLAFNRDPRLAEGVAA